MKYIPYVLPIVLAMIVGYAYQQNISVMTVLPVLLVLTAAALGFWYAKRPKSDV